jgi:hypothetical protein
MVGNIKGGMQIGHGIVEATSSHPAGGSVCQIDPAGSAQVDRSVVGGGPDAALPKRLSSKQKAAAPSASRPKVSNLG